jgi:hypothetical protein
MSTPDLSAPLLRAEAFLRANARLLERRRFAARYLHEPRESVLVALRAYQNDDGGFGHALLPEERAPASSVRATAFALSVLAELDALELTHPVLRRALAYLESARCELGPTAACAALLTRHSISHPWLRSTVEHCWRALAIYADPPAGSRGEPPCFETLHPALELLACTEPPQDLPIDPQKLVARIETLVLEWDLVVFDAEQHDTVGTPLDWAPRPDSPARPLFTRRQIDRHLDALIAQQTPEGGWSPRVHGPSSASRIERAGIRTLEALAILCSYGPRSSTQDLSWVE